MIQPFNWTRSSWDGEETLASMKKPEKGGGGLLGANGGNGASTDECEMGLWGGHTISCPRVRYLHYCWASAT
jgi:hypothetical protein